MTDDSVVISVSSRLLLSILRNLIHCLGIEICIRDFLPAGLLAPPYPTYFYPEHNLVIVIPSPRIQGKISPSLVRTKTRRAREWELN